MAALPAHLCKLLDLDSPWEQAQASMEDPLPVGWTGTHQEPPGLRARMAHALGTYAVRMAARAHDLAVQEPGQAHLHTAQKRYWQAHTGYLDCWRLGAGYQLVQHQLPHGWLDVACGLARLMLCTEATYQQPVSLADRMLAVDVLAPTMAALHTLLNYTMDPLDPGTLDGWLRALQVRAGLDPDTGDLFTR